MIGGNIFITCLISASVVSLPKVNLIELCATSGLIPMARSTCEAFKLDEAQAEPVETAIPFRSNEIKIDSPSTPKKRKMGVRRSGNFPVSI